MIEGDQRWTYGRARRSLRPAGPCLAARRRRATGGRGGVALRQHPRAAGGVLRRAAGRWGAAPPQHPPGAPPSCARSSTTAEPSCCSGTRPSPTRATASARSCSTTPTRRCSPSQPATPPGHPDRSTSGHPPSSSTRRAPPARPRARSLSHRGLYLHAVHSALDHGPDGRRRVPPHDPALPRQRVGHAALRHRPGRRARAAPPLRRRRGPPAGRGARRHAALPRARDGASRARPSRRGRTATCPACAQISVGGSASSPALLAELEAAFGCPVICGYGMTESSPTLTRSLPKPGLPYTADAARHHRPADPRHRRARAWPWRHRGAVGRRPRRRDLRPLQPRDDRLPRRARGDRRGPARRMAPHRRPRRRRRRRLHHDRRPSQGPHRLRR